MARDLDVIRRYSQLSEQEAALLGSPAAPIVLLQCRTDAPKPAIAAAVAPGMNTLGFMLPNTPLHHLMLLRMDRPIVLTSGNLSDEPQAISAEDAHQRLGPIAEYFLEHNRPIARRVDDSVARVVAGQTRVLRRARGLAPAPLTLPPGFERAPSVLAYGSELKNTFCMARDGTAVLSPHIGDLEDALTRDDYHKALEDFRAFLEFEPRVLACDLHPGYASTRLACTRSAETGLPLHASQHHHAHIAACMAENAVPLGAAPVLGVALDGIGYGDDQTLWGGEFLLADYLGFERLGTFKPVALIGGDAAARAPWRNTYAHLMAEMGWAAFAMNYAELELFQYLEQQPRALLDGMLKQGLNVPLASSCGRLFDAVAAAVGLAREHAYYEGQGAVELEAVVDVDCLDHEDAALDYPFAIPMLPGSKMAYIEPLAMWQALLGDLVAAHPGRRDGGALSSRAGQGHREDGGEDCQSHQQGRRSFAAGGAHRWGVPEPHPVRACLARPGGQRIFCADPSSGAVQRRRPGLGTGSHRRGAPHGATLVPRRVIIMCLGIPGRIVEINNADFCIGTVDVAGVRRQVNLACIVTDEHPVESCIGDWVLVHVGFAMSRINESEAKLTLDLLTQLGEAQAEIDAMRITIDAMRIPEATRAA